MVVKSIRGVEEMSTNEKENTEMNDIEQQPLHEQYENGVRLALTLYEWCIERIVLFPDSDTSKRVLDAIDRARTKPVPMDKLNVTKEISDPYARNIEVCSKLTMVAGDMIQYELADITNVDTSITDFMCWDQFRAKIHSRIVRCVNNMLYD